MAKRGVFKRNAKPSAVRQRKFAGTAAQKKNRAARNKARAQAIAAGTVKKGDGKVIHHKKRLGAGGTNAPSNRAVQSAKASTQEGGRVRKRAKKKVAKKR